MVGRPHPTHWFVVWTLVISVLIWVIRRRVEVAGESMLPAFRPGDRLLLVPVFRVRAGQVVAVRDSRHSGRLLVKRVHEVQGSMVQVRGDNPEASTDSRHFGPVLRSAVVGRVMYRYAPAFRSQWWPQ